MVALLWVLHLGSTLAMTGVIWLVQVVQYPLFAKVGSSDFMAYHAGHARLITWVVLPLMGLELLSALALAFVPPSGVPRGAVLAGLALVGAIWASTALVQVPQHELLARGFDPEVHRALVTANLIRTVAWTARSVLFLGLTAQLLGGLEAARDVGG